MAKSLLLAAYYPSKPDIPTPTCAAVIMLTSLAPSPIDSVVLLGCFCLIMFTISAFYFGETLQAKTTVTLSARVMNSYLSSSLLSILKIV